MALRCVNFFWPTLRFELCTPELRSSYDTQIFFEIIMPFFQLFCHSKTLWKTNLTKYNSHLQSNALVKVQLNAQLKLKTIFDELKNNLMTSVTNLFLELRTLLQICFVVGNLESFIAWTRKSQFHKHFTKKAFWTIFFVQKKLSAKKAASNTFEH